MQEKNNQQKQQSEKTGKKRFTVWGILGGGLVLFAFVFIIWFYSWMPMHIERDLSDKLPWVQDGLAVKEVKAGWKSAAGNAFLAQRTHLYPEAKIVLEQAAGKGRIDVIFLNPEGTQVGDTHFLSYENGQFEKKNDRTAQTDGTAATVWLETGYDSADLFTLHRMNQVENLWRVVLIHRAEKSPNGVRLGQRSIKAEVIPTSSENEQQ